MTPKSLGKIPMTRNDDSHNCDKSDPQLLLPNFWCHISTILKTTIAFLRSLVKHPDFVCFQLVSIYLSTARCLPAPPPRATSPVLQRALHERILRPQWHHKLHPNLATLVDWKLQRAAGCLFFGWLDSKPNYWEKKNVS